MLEHRKEDGFTMIEMMVAVAILAILAAIIVPAYSTYQKRTERDQVRADLVASATVINSKFGGNPSAYPVVIPEDAKQTSSNSTLSYTVPQERNAYCLRAVDKNVTLFYSSATGQVSETDCSFPTGSAASSALTLDFVQTNQKVDVIGSGGTSYAQVTGYFQWGSVPGAARYAIREYDNNALKYEHDLSKKETYSATENTPGKLGYSNATTTASSEELFFSADGTPVTRTPLRQFDLNNGYGSVPKSYRVIAYDNAGNILSQSTATPMASPVSGLFQKTYTYNGTSNQTWAGVSSSAQLSADYKYYSRTLDWSAIQNHSAYSTVKKYVVADSSGRLDSSNILATLNANQFTYVHTQRLDDRMAYQDPLSPGKFVDTDLALYVIADSDNNGQDETYQVDRWLSLNSTLARGAPTEDAGVLDYYTIDGSGRRFVNFTVKESGFAVGQWSPITQVFCYPADSTIIPTLVATVDRSTVNKSFAVQVDTYNRCQLVTELLINKKKYASNETLNGYPSPTGAKGQLQSGRLISTK